MSVVLALLMAIVIILVAAIRSKKPEDAAVPVLLKRYVHPGHGWIEETGDGYVIVGIDDFTQGLIGTVHEIKLPRLLSRVRQGTTAWELSHGGRKLSMVSPVSGWVVEKNEAVMHNPRLINASPYGEGWLIKVKPTELRAELNNTLSGRAAHKWQDFVRANLAGLFSGNAALSFQDGGVIISDLSERCSDEEWRRICREFFNPE